MAEKIPSGRQLSSWKEIADFLGVTERTAQYWEQEKSLPIKRVAGARGRVSADADELERWKRSVLHRVPWHSSVKFLRFSTAISSAALILMGGILIGTQIAANRVGPPARYQIDVDTVIVRDQTGREVWRKTFEDRFFAGAYTETGITDSRMIWFGRLGTRHGISTLFVYYPISRNTKGTALICFSEKGEELWRFTPGMPVSDREGRYSPTYAIGDFRVTSLLPGGPLRILITSHHTYHDPNQFAVLDENGKLLHQYWHSGYLPTLEVADINGDGINEILLAGVNNGYRSATLVVLDPRKIGGASTQQRGDPTQLQGFGPGTESAIFLFPRSCVSQRRQYNIVSNLSATRGLVKVDVEEVENEGRALVIYEFNGNLEPKDVTISDFLKDVHNAMSAKGELDHPFSESESEILKRNLRKLPQ